MKDHESQFLTKYPSFLKNPVKFGMFGDEIQYFAFSTKRFVLRGNYEMRWYRMTHNYDYTIFSKLGEDCPSRQCGCGLRNRLCVLLKYFQQTWYVFLANACRWLCCLFLIYWNNSPAISIAQPYKKVCLNDELIAVTLMNTHVFDWKLL